MRRFSVVSLLLLAAATARGSQTPPSRPTMAITIGPVGKDWVAAVGLQQTEPYIGGPAAEVEAGAGVPEAKLIASGFSIRAWKEADKARVMVYAVMMDDRAPKGQTETPISTFTLTLGQTVEVQETADWGAAHVAVRAIPAPGTASAPAANRS